MKAWKVQARNWLEMKVVVAAPTRGKAIANVHRQKESAGYPSSFTDFRAIRVPSFDDDSISKVETLGWEDGHTKYGCLEVNDDS